jgi:pilus assembly protein Flp/PilA
MSSFLKKVRQDEVGATAIEYGLVAVFMAVVIIAVMQTLGTGLKGTFQTVANAI